MFIEVRACQHGLTPRQIVHRYDRQPDPDELFTDIEAAQQPAASDDHALLQSSCTILHWPPILQGRSSWHVQPDKTFHNFEECQAPEIEVSRHDRVPQQRHANHEVGTTPAWRTSLEHEFTARAEVANDEEGPIAFVTTWYLQGPLEQLSEESRPLRLDQFTRHWKRDLEELWQDRILRTVPLHIVHVQPEPPQHDRSWTIGHVILYQSFYPPLVPFLITINFLTDRHTGINYVAAALNTPKDNVTSLEVALIAYVNSKLANVSIEIVSLFICVQEQVPSSMCILQFRPIMLEMSNKLAHNGSLLARRLNNPYLLLHRFWPIKLTSLLTSSSIGTFTPELVLDMLSVYLLLQHGVCTLIVFE